MKAEQCILREVEILREQLAYFMELLNLSDEQIQDAIRSAHTFAWSTYEEES